MVVDTDANLAIVEIMKGRNENIIDGIWVQKINSHHRKDHRLLVLTESSASLCRAKKSSKVVSVSRIYQWFSITSVECTTPKVISLNFGPGDDLTFVCNSHNLILEHIVAHLRDILHHREMPNIHCPGIDVGGILSVHNPLAALKRLRARIFCVATLMPDDLNEKFRQFLEMNTNELNMGSVPYGTFCKEVLDSINVEARITKVVFPKCEVTHWRDIAHFLANAKEARRFETMERIDSTFLALSEPKKWNSSITELSFACQKYSQHELSIIADLCTRENIRALEFHGGLNTKLLSEMLRGIRESALKCLKLENIEFVCVMKDFEILRSFESLSLVNCQLEISELLSMMNDDGFLVKHLDLSRNKFQKPTAKGWWFPPSVESLTMDDVETSVPVFGVFLKAALRSTTPLSLSLNHLNLSQEETVTLFNDIVHVPASRECDHYRITEFHWDRNCVCSSFFVLMEKCTPLNVLSLNEVFSQKSHVRDLVRFIQNTCAVQVLNLAGRHGVGMNVSALTHVIDALRTNRSITALDISWNEREDGFLARLADVLMKNRVIDTLVMCDKQLTSRSLNAFLRSLHGRGTPLRVEVTAMERYEQETRSLLAAVAEGDSSIVIPSPCLKRMKHRVHSAETPPVDPLGVPFRELDEYVWELPQVTTLPRVDNRKILSDLANEFSMYNIVARMRKR